MKLKKYFNDKTIVITFDVLTFIIFLMLIKRYPDAFCIVYPILLLISYILLLITTKKKLISKYSITFHLIFIIASFIISYLIINLNIIKLPDGFGGLGSAVVFILYYLIQTTYLGIMLLTDLIKTLIKKK